MAHSSNISLSSSCAFLSFSRVILYVGHLPPRPAVGVGGGGGGLGIIAKAPPIHKPRNERYPACMPDGAAAPPIQGASIERTPCEPPTGALMPNRNSGE